MSDYMDRYNPLTVARFWSKVHIPDNEAECWMWQGAQHSRGYGLVRVAGSLRRAHLVAWELFNATAFPEGHVRQ